VFSSVEVDIEVQNIRHLSEEGAMRRTLSIGRAAMRGSRHPHLSAAAAASSFLIDAGGIRASLSSYPVMDGALGEDAAQNQAAMDKLVAELRGKLDRVREGGGKVARDRHTARGKLLARDRIELLVDEGTPFLEVGPLVGMGVYDDDIPSGGVVAGIGCVHGRHCMIVANDATVKGGAYFPVTVKKHLRAQEIAMENGLPCIYLVDSGGAFLPLQSEVFPDKLHFGRIFYNQANMSATGIPQIAVVMGSCTAGGAYVPAMCDETVMVSGTGTIFLAGPPLVKAATGEVVTAEDLGGAAVHCEKSGVADHFARDDQHAIAITRDIVASLHPPSSLPAEAPSWSEPRFSAAEMGAAIPVDPRKPFDVRQIIARIVDGSQFQEVRHFIISAVR
jgi:3-methylcrotonyl-CoA carboxylase beta subunit